MKYNLAEKLAIVKDYDSKGKGRTSWLDKNHKLIPSDIDRFKKQLKQAEMWPPKKDDS